MSDPNRSSSYRDNKTKLVARDISESLGKLPPSAADLEEAVLGALMLEKTAIIEIPFLRSDHFYVEAHRIIHQAITELFAAGDPIDMRTVVAQLRKTGKLELVEGAYKIAELTSKIASASNIEYHARIIIEMSLKRSLIEIASQIHHDAYEDTVDVFDLYNRSNLQMQEVLDSAVVNRSEQPVKDIAAEVSTEIASRMSGTHSGLDSGYEVVDKLLNGFNKTDLIIVAARPGMGKSAFAIQAAKNIAAKGVPVGVFSLEMGAQQIVERLAIADSEVVGERVKRGEIDIFELQRLQKSLSAMYKGMPLYIDDTAFLTIVELRARAMRMKAKYGIQLLVIDYLQLIKGIGENRLGNRDQEIGVITRTLKGIAKELDIPVIALSQLSREAEKRGKTARPQLSDLRESGSIESDADIVMFLWRPEYYKIFQDEVGVSTHGQCEVIVAKHRNGPLDTVLLKFIGKYTKFAAWDVVEPTRRMDQAEYAQKHSKSPLPSERPVEDFEPNQPSQDASSDLPF